MKTESQSFYLYHTENAAKTRATKCFHFKDSWAAAKPTISISHDLSRALPRERLDTFILCDHLLYAQTFALILFRLLFAASSEYCRTARHFLPRFIICKLRMVFAMGDFSRYFPHKTNFELGWRFFKCMHEAIRIMRLQPNTHCSLQHIFICLCLIFIPYMKNQHWFTIRVFGRAFCIGPTV